MTWDEFKEIVDKKLEEEGMNGSIEIDYIDLRKGHIEAEDVRCGGDYGMYITDI